MKKIVSVLLAVVFAASFFVFAYAYESEVNDYANLFSEDELSQIASAAADYVASTDISLSVLTINDAQGLSSEEYANDYIDNLIKKMHSFISLETSALILQGCKVVIFDYDVQ